MNGIESTPFSYLAQNCAMPFCKGCGHSHVLRKINEAFVALKLDPKDVCLVTDIGCIGLADASFELPHTVHTTHGRSTAFATGIKLADNILAESKLKTIVLIGDGGAMIGLLHLVNAALLNVDITVILCNNFLFGMTGGQNSAFSPLDFITPTTPVGNIIPPLDLCAVMKDAHAGFVARKLATDKDLSEFITKAIEYPGFSMIEIVELCTEHATTRNQLSGNAIHTILDGQGQQQGILVERNGREEFGAVYSNKFSRKSPADKVQGKKPPAVQYESQLQRKVGIVIAASAGERVQSVAGTFCEAAAQSGLQSTQKSDNPVTQGSGFSSSEVCISPTEIFYTGIDEPDVVIAVSDDGLYELKAKKIFNRLSPSSIVILDSSLEKPKTEAKIYNVPFRKNCGADKAAAGAFMLALELIHIYPADAFDKLLRQRYRVEQSIFSADFISLIRTLVRTKK